ncbi:MAG: C2 family cysteine protease [Terriglobia bacterium]|jgi:hypothetical protein
MALLLCSMALPLQGVAADLYGPQGVKPQAVRQGKLGSCYFHAVIAALAEFQAQGLQRMIQANSDGSYTVRFADGVKENAYAEDVRYTRESGYDLSEGLWVAVLFRAYAQRVLRQSLVSGIEKSELFPFVKLYVKDFVATNDPLLLAYDRAIRSQVDQYGNIDRSKLEWQLREEMRPLSVPDAMQEAVIKLLASGGFLDSLAEVIKQNGEIFGAYRAVGQGGIAERVMQAMTGSVRFVKNESAEQAGGALEQALQAGLPVVACSGGSQYSQELGEGRVLPADTKNWYVNAHCYTALAYDGNGPTVTLRNPWARFPEPDGVFTLPVKTFVPAFRGIITTQQ